MPVQVEVPELKAKADETARNETVLAKKLKKTLQLRLENDAETVDALKELSTFFHVCFCSSPKISCWSNDFTLNFKQSDVCVFKIQNPVILKELRYFFPS